MSTRMFMALLVVCSLFVFVVSVLSVAKSNATRKQLRTDLATSKQSFIGYKEASEARLQDTNMLNEALLGCYKARREDLVREENLRWQMQVVIDSCPGRVRAPKLPRP